jgi:enterobactin synthetase component D / holo-[acyl-carrier protein] synthase
MSPPADIGIAENGLPLWPDGWVGSITHANRIAAAAVACRSSCGALGIDVEERIAPTLAAEISSQISSPGEMSLLKALDPPTALTVIFSAKESLYKALYPYVLKFFDFAAATVSGFSETSVHLSLTENWGDGWRKGTCVPVQYSIVRDHIFTAACMSSGELASD